MPREGARGPAPGPTPGPSREVLRTREDAEAYVASVCFKHGPPRLIGVELEWLLRQPTKPSAPPDAEALVAALGPHTPTTLDASSPALPLPAGSAVSVEPGGQVELASQPYGDLSSLLAATRSDARRLHRLLAGHDLHPYGSGADPVRAAHRILRIPRYLAMEAAFDRIGPHGRSMMCSTAAVQVSLDVGEPPDVARRWAALHALGPVLVAAFANSPIMHGRLTGWKSTRMACWLALDPPRTAPPREAHAAAEADPAPVYARRALDTPLLCVRRGEPTWDAPAGVSFADWVAGALPTPPTTADLDLHLSTLFPPVRPHGHFEVRYLDCQPDEQWALPVLVLASLLSTPGTTSAALEACAPAATRWTAAARHGLADRVLAKAAAVVFGLAIDALPALDVPRAQCALLAEVTERRVLRGRCPADDEIELRGGDT